jgi:hypothetical protein
MQVIVEGTLTADGTLVLDGKLNLAPGRVQVIVQPLPELPPDDPFWQRMRAIWDGQAARGHAPRSAEEVERARRSLREEMDREMHEAFRLQEESRRLRQQK